MRFNWLILGHYCHIHCTCAAVINNILTWNVWSLRENPKSRACRVDLAIARSIWQGLGLRFSCEDLALGKYVVSNLHQKNCLVTLNLAILQANAAPTF